MKHRLAPLAASAAALALTLTACGGGSPAGTADASADAAGTSGSGTTEDGLQQVTVGLMPIAVSAAFEYGLQEGIFEDHGFAVETSSSASGAATLPAVANGQIDFDIGNPMSVGIAVDEGLDLRIVSGFSNSLPEGDDIAGIVVRAGSGIEDYGDLEGRTTAVVSLMGHNTLTTQDVAEQDGADPQKVGFTELQFGDMPAQLEQGNIDAMFVPEPFLSQALADQENELLGYNFQDSIPGLPTLVTYTSGTLAEEDPELVADFQAAMEDVLSQAQENPEEAKAVLTDFLDIPAEAAASMRLEEWNGEIRQDELNRLWDLAVAHEYIDEPISPEEIYFHQ